MPVKLKFLRETATETSIPERFKSLSIVSPSKTTGSVAVRRISVSCSADNFCSLSANDSCICILER